MKLVYLEEDNIIGPGDRKGRGSKNSYIVAVGEAKEDFGEKIESPPGGICVLPRISLPIGSMADIIIDGSVYTSFLVRNVKIIARGKPDELGEAMPKEVHKVLKRQRICFIVYLVFKLLSGNRLWIENSFVTLHKQ